ncbi:hypothetical protein [Alteraurantiacibacter palmitatis]|uniref:Uncharacterized protein n=1 Tax=Alteraurantiacibacter palmitatis TaxID=2054628 RepID=A0ABV7E6G8_9SPHN
MKSATRYLAAALAALALPLGAGASLAQQDQAQEAREARNYSVETTPVGTLLDDPEAAAILQRLIPAVYANEMFQSLGRPNTLRGVQQYEPATLTNAKLAEIQAEFDKLDG